jgi:hypothetical protein
MRGEEISYAKWVQDERGELVKRYWATDPADLAVVCTCGRESCHRVRLLGFREHVAELYRVLRRVNEEELAVDDSSGWESVLYGLRMAASIEDVEADTGYVEDPMVFAVCEPTIDYERGQSEMASKYVAGATVFNFLWQAYEAIVAVTATDELRGLAKQQRFGERGRRLLETRPGLTARFRGCGDLVKVALLQCRKGGRMAERCDRIEEKFGRDDLAAAAEVAREYRNFLFHGGDEAPAHEDWGDAITSRCRIYRFYSVSRLVLYLIQAMCWIVHQDITESYEYGSDCDDLTTKEILERLQFKGPGIWPPLDRKTA